MRIVIQRVLNASISTNEVVISSIGTGLLVFLGIVKEDTQEDIDWLTNKIINLRIFNDSKQVMNKSLMDLNGQCLVVSQFTLHAKTKKGNRPSYIDAANPQVAIPLYNDFVDTLQFKLGSKVFTGKFGADMQVQLTNDGPVTIIIDSKKRE